MQLSVIIATYSAPERLALVQLIVADDGSDGRTASCIVRLRRQTGLAVRRGWQEDRGFRTGTILNRAAEAARGEYVVFTDDDCIPRADFLATHAALAMPETFLSGGCVRLPQSVGERILAPVVRAGRATDWGCLRAHRLPLRHRRRRLELGSRPACVWDSPTTTRATWTPYGIRRESPRRESTAARAASGPFFHEGHHA